MVADKRKIHDELLELVTVKLIELNNAIIQAEGGPATEAGKAAWTSFCEAMGDPKYRRGAARHMDGGPKRLKEYLKETNYFEDNTRIVNFLEVAGALLESGINSQFYKETCRSSFGGLLTLMYNHPRMMEYYQKVTCWSKGSNVSNSISEREKAFWERYPRKFTAHIDLELGDSLEMPVLQIEKPNTSLGGMHPPDRRGRTDMDSLFPKDPGKNK